MLKIEVYTEDYRRPGKIRNESGWTFEFQADETLWNLRDQIGQKTCTEESDYYGFRFFYYPKGSEIEEEDKTKLYEIFNFTEDENVTQVCFQPHETAAVVAITSDQNVEILDGTKIMKLRANEEKSVNFRRAKFGRSWPIEFRYVLPTVATANTDPIHQPTVVDNRKHLIVRHFEVKKAKRFCLRHNDQDDFFIDKIDKSGTVIGTVNQYQGILYKFEKVREKDGKSRYRRKDRKKDGIVLPKPFSPSEREKLPFGMEKCLIKSTIQDAMKCCLASYEDFQIFQRWKLDNNILKNKSQNKGGTWKPNDNWNFETKDESFINFIEDFKKDKAGQLLEKGEPDADGYFTLTNSETDKVLTAFSSNAFEFKELEKTEEYWTKLFTGRGLTMIETYWFENEDKTMKQKCVISYHETREEMIISFRGSADDRDWLVNLSVELVDEDGEKSLELNDNLDKNKYHEGYLMTSKMCTSELIPLIESSQHKPKKIIVCGHSKGAAVSACVYIALSKALGEYFEIINLTFALPMFGNTTLKKSLELNGNLDQNMYHFVKSKDIVPGLLFIGHTYERLSPSVKWLLYDWVVDQKVLDPEMNKTAKNFLAEVRKKKENKGLLFQPKGQDYYVPIGQYVLLHDTEEKVYALPNEIQWIGQALVDPLRILKNIGGYTSGGIEATATKIGQDIRDDHSLDGYEDIIKKCLLDVA